MLLQCFENKQKGAKMLDEMDSSQQKGSVAYYNFEFMLLAEKISKTGPEDLCHRYQKGLKGEIYKRLFLNWDEADLKTSMSYTLRCERAISRYKEKPKVSEKKVVLENVQEMKSQRYWLGE
jgi:hypothetical protein